MILKFKVLTIHNLQILLVPFRQIGLFNVDIRNVSWQLVLTSIFLFENYALHIIILVIWHSYVALISNNIYNLGVPFFFIPFIMIAKCKKSSWILPQDLIRNSSTQKYLLVVQGKL